MSDTVRYAIGFGALGELARRALVRRDLEAIFAFGAERPGELRRGYVRRLARAASPSKIRLTPGRSPGESARWLTSARRRRGRR